MKRIIFLIIIFLIAYSLFSLEIIDGRIKLVLHDSTGRYSIYYLDDARTNKYLPLLLDQDPRTTVLSVLVGNKVYNMGESSVFRQTIEQLNNGAAFVWTSSFMVVKQSFEFITSNNNVLSDGVKMKISISNTSSQDLYVGIRLLFDTYLGENSNNHFLTDSISNVSGETEFTNSIPSYWVSPSENTSSKGIQIMTSGTGVTVPDRIVFANWSRLNDSSWNFSTKTNRNFNYLPYSINDSAVVQYYNPTTVAGGSTTEISLLMGNFNNSGFVLDSVLVSDEMTDLFEQVVSTDSTEDLVVSVKADLQAIKDLLAQIDKMILNGQELTVEELSVMEQIISNLEERKAQY